MARSFNCDLCVQHDVERVISALDIKYGVETGTYNADTTLFLANLLKGVKTIEINKNQVDVCKKILKDNSNVEIFCGNSGEILKDVIVGIPTDNVVMFYLDAHWNGYWPLLDELKEISKHFNNNAFIVIDDFQVPGKQLGYDSYAQGANNLNYVSSSLAECGELFIFFNNHTKVVDKLNSDRGTAGKLYAIPRKYADKISSFLILENGFYYSNTKL